MNFLSQLSGCFAQPCAENPSIAMMEAAYRHHNLDWRYINCEVGPATLGDAVRGAKAMGWAGFNCSLPNKVEVIQYLDELGESAKIIGAVNCAVRRGEKWIGENTDGKGFLKSLEETINPTGKKLVLFGAGGAARAIGVEVALAGASSVIVVNRSADRGQQLVDLLNEKTPAEATFVKWQGDYDIPAGTDIVVNSTSIGLYPNVEDRVPVNPDTLTDSMVVADVIPNPPQTKFLDEAKDRGCRCIDGLGMLVNQGVIGIKYWTDVDADPTAMRNKLEEIFG